MSTPVPGLGAPRVRPVLTAHEIDRTLRRLAHEIHEHASPCHELMLVGIETRGVPLARRLADRLQSLTSRAVPVVALDAGPYRDDLPGPRRPPLPAEPVGDFADRHVILVDDVLYTGRTVRAALDAVSDRGRPARAQLVVLVDRGHRELPIRADYVGKNLPTSHDERVTVRLLECDGVDGVWIEVQDAGGRP